MGMTTTSFTPREKQVVEMICKGMTDREIGAALGISKHTVKSLLRLIFSRTGIDNRTALAVWWTRKNNASNGSEAQPSENHSP